MTTTIQSYLYGTGVDYTIGDLAPNLYLLYYYYPCQFYAWSTAYPTRWFLTGVPGGYVCDSWWREWTLLGYSGPVEPVDGLGQINVYGLATYFRT
ncbi:hypothetical protein [Vulcanisaeta distributa]|uniref:hypothetical protein n=1 Tax=Vulcanisaeta distributa TaxID=164451 RepID=UPI000A9EF371|nr:hypothetical protein [Vulcanisaeta distributa]